MKIVKMMFLCIFICLVLISCDQPKSDLPDGTRKSESNLPDIIQEIESDIVTETDEPELIVDDNAPITLPDIESYREFIATQYIPWHFIPYERLESIGEYGGLRISNREDISEYQYSIVDKNGFHVRVSVDKLGRGEGLVTDHYEESEILYLDELDKDKVVYNEECANKIVIFDGIKYKYGVNGELVDVSVIMGGSKVTFSTVTIQSGESGEYIHFKFSDYNPESENMLSDLLSGKHPEGLELELEGKTYAEIVQIYGEQSFGSFGEKIWSLPGGRLMRLHFQKGDLDWSSDQITVNDVYVFSKVSTGIHRVTDADKVERVEIHYMIYDTVVELTDDRETIKKLVEYVNDAGSNFANSTRGYYGASYSIVFYTSDEEPFSFVVWSEDSFQTNEYKDPSYELMAYGDISELVEFLKTEYPESLFIKE